MRSRGDEEVDIKLRNPVAYEVVKEAGLYDRALLKAAGVENLQRVGELNEMVCS